MNTLSTAALAALFAFPLAALTAFLVMPLRRAILSGYLLGWMFLPQGTLEVPGILPNYERGVAIAVGVLGSLVLFDGPRLLRLRPGWIDAPMALYLALPVASSLANHLGLYDGLSEMTERVLRHLPPYLLGRLYFSDREGLRQLAVAVLVGGVVYLPLCALEMRLSPQLHAWVYGAHQHSFSQTQRLGGYRPMVFMQHGLAVAMWMTTATLAGVWLLRARVLRSPAWLLIVPALALVALLCRSIGALLLLVVGSVVLAGSRTTRSAAPLFVLLAVAPLYVGLRGSGLADGSTAVALARDLFPADRVQSFDFRVRNENLLVERAHVQPVLGWGGWARSQIQSRRGEQLSVTDGMWIITFGQNGVVGLVAYLLATALPALVFAWTVPARLWSRPHVAPAALLAVVCALYTVDNLMNAMFNPLVTLALGALAGLLRHPRRGLVELVRASDFRGPGDPSAELPAPDVARQGRPSGLRLAPVPRRGPRGGATEEEAAA